MNGQWFGTFGGPTPGQIIVNIDELESSYEGVAFLFNDDATLPGAAAGFVIPNKAAKFEIRTNYLLAIDPKTMQTVPLEQVQPRFGAFSDAEIRSCLTLQPQHVRHFYYRTQHARPRRASGEP